MTRFLDGPAANKTLMLGRTPVFLRVVIDRDGTVDALNNLEDAPKPSEVCHAYQITGTPGWCHINRGGGRGGRYGVADYKLCTVQPSPEIMRDAGAWEIWVNAEAKRQGLTK
jgi:hypothetical protein